MVHIQNLSDISISSLEEGCKHLGMILGLEEPVKLPILIGALRNEEYAHNLLTCRKTPALLNSLLKSPPDYDLEEMTDNRSSKDLLMQASVSLVKWAKKGFTIATEEVIVQRRKACIACPHLRSASDNILYKTLNSKAVCSLCGCDIESKTRLNSESCPSEDLNNAGYNRWGQEFIKK